MITWRTNYYNQKHQQQQRLVIPSIKEINDKLNDLENRSHRNNLRINGIIEGKNKSWSQSEKKLQEVVKNQLQIEWDIEIESAHCSGKTVIDGSPNKRRIIIAKLLNFMESFIRVQNTKVMNRTYIYKLGFFWKYYGETQKSLSKS